MGICCNNVVENYIKAKEIYFVNGCEVELIIGNIFYHDLDLIILPSNHILKLRSKYLNFDTIKIQKQCIKYLKIKKKINPGDIFISKGVKSKNIIHIVFPCYVDGMIGEPDYLKLAIQSSLEKSKELDVKSIGINAEWIYPKAQLTKILYDEIFKFLQQKTITRMSIFCEDEKIVMIIKMYFFKKYLDKEDFGNSVKEN